MGNERKLRLIQVAKEFKVGLNTITDFLQKKGIKSDGSPNTLVDAETYAVLEKEFGANRNAGNARESVRERISMKQGTVTLEAAKQKEREEEKEVVIKSHVISVKDEIPQPKFLGKIDLNPNRRLRSPIPSLHKARQRLPLPQTVPYRPPSRRPRRRNRPLPHSRPHPPPSRRLRRARLRHRPLPPPLKRHPRLPKQLRPRLRRTTFSVRPSRRWPDLRCSARWMSRASFRADATSASACRRRRST